MIENVRIIQFVLILLAFTGCGHNSNGTNSSNNPNPATSGNGNSGTPTPGGPSVSTHALATIESGGSTVAHIIYFGANQVLVYIPSVDRYTGYVRLSDGNYVGMPFYWSGANCMGTPFLTGFIGETGKTVYYEGYTSTYYLVTALYAVGTALSYQSYSYQGTCTNGSSTITATDGAAQVTQTTRPYNFSAIAPLTVKFP